MLKLRETLRKVFYEMKTTLRLVKVKRDKQN
jgi:hypothetical protein